MRERGAWEGGTRGVPPPSFAGAPRVFAKKKGRRPPRGRAAFSRSGPLARASRVCRRPFACRRSASRVFLGRGPEGGLRFDALGVRCLSPLLLAQPLPLPCFVWWANLRKGTLRRPWSLFRASEGVVEALLAASPGRSDSNSAYCGCSALA